MGSDGTGGFQSTTGWELRTDVRILLVMVGYYTLVVGNALLRTLGAAYPTLQAVSYGLPSD